MTNQEKFYNLLSENCSNRFDVDVLYQYLKEDTDFFQAPASTKFHSNVNGGLLLHSLTVYDTLNKLLTMFNLKYSKDTITIVALLHDLCKANFYKLSTKNVKVNGSWTTQPCYIVDDSFPVGHGEKSVIELLRLGLNLTDEEIYAIRWHMGAFDNSVKGGDLSFSVAMTKSKLATLLQVADLISSQVLEEAI